MIKIPGDIVDEIFDHGNIDIPNEACGYLAGINGEVVKRIALTNVDHSPEHFRLDPKEQFEAFKNAKKEGLKLLSVYHTHPVTPARPSEEDIKLAFDPNISYVIASVIDKEIRSFRIRNGEVEVEEVEIG
ncbi:MAG: M67 family metallopeptidase [Spirochaetaceae bacterium]